MRSHKIRLITLLSMATLAVSASVFFAFASWQFNKTASTPEITDVGVTQWEFQSPIEPGQVITVDDDGNITIDGQPVPDGEVTYPGGQTPNANGGSINYEVGVDDDGNLVVTEYDASGLNSNYVLFGDSNSVVSLPGSVIINGESYPIVKLSQPIDLDVTKNTWAILASSTVEVNIPEGYTYVCDGAFSHLSANRNTAFTFNLPKSLDYLGNGAFKLNANNCSVTINYAGTTTEFKNLVNTSAAQFGEGYKFFTGASGRVTVHCYGGDVVYNTNGSVYSG